MVGHGCHPIFKACSGGDSDSGSTTTAGRADSLKNMLIIAVGAALGANARYLVGLWAANRFGLGLPYGTLLANLSGCLLLGFLVTLGSGRVGLSQELRLLFAVGFLGSYTTFSSFAVETLNLAQGGAWGRSWLNLLANNGLGLMAAWVGVTLARLLE
jgi:CrcB protein